MEPSVAEAVCIVFLALLGVCKNFMGSLDRLELRVELKLLTRIAVRMIFES